LSTLPTAVPPTGPEDRRFWEGAVEGVLRLPRCDECGLVIFYPRLWCPGCHSDHTTWSELSGRGTVYSYTVTRRIPGRWREHIPFVLAYVELEEGPRVLTNVVGCDPETVAIGMPVVAVFDDAGDGTAILRFQPAEAPERISRG